MIKFGKGGTQKCNDKWHETYQYMNIVDYCEHELEKFDKERLDKKEIKDQKKNI